MDTKKTAAEIILEQLGGARFLAMTGAKAIKDDARAELTLKFPSMARCRCIVIAYAKAVDTYSVTAYKTAASKSELPLEPKHGWHAEQLRRLVEDLTGMRTSLF